MTSILLNVILCSAVLVAVVAPLLWAILTAHRDQSAVITNARLNRDATPQPRFRGAKHGQTSDAASWGVHHTSHGDQLPLPALSRPGVQR